MPHWTFQILRRLLSAAAIVACALAPATAVAQVLTQPPLGPLAPPAPAAAPAARPQPFAFDSAELDLVARVSLGSAPVAQAGVDGLRAYVPTKDGHLIAVDLTARRVLWTIEMATTWQPAAGDGMVFVAGEDRLTALAPDQQIRWSLPLRGGFSAPLLWDTGWLIAGTSLGEVLCIRAVDGHVLWARAVGSPVRARPSIAGDRLYLSLEDGRVLALALRDGAPIWEHALGGTPGQVLALDERLYVGSKDKFFYCLRTRDGKQEWRWRTGGTISGMPAIDTKRVYFTSLDNVLRALDRNNGWQKWKAGLPLRPTSGPLLSGTVLYVGGVAAELRGYRAASGELAGRYDAPSDLAAPPQHMPGQIPELDTILLLTRSGELLILGRRLEPAIVPPTLPLGIEVPLTAPPVPVPSAAAPSPEPEVTPLYEMPGVLTMEPAGPPQD